MNNKQELKNLEKAIKDFYIKQNKKVSPRTLKFHYETLRKLFSVLNIENDFLNIKNVSNYEYVINILKKHYGEKLTTINNFIKSISIFIQMVDGANIILLKKYREYMFITNEKMKKKQNIKMSNEILPISQKDIIKIDEEFKSEIIKIIVDDNMSIKSKKLIKKYIIFVLYSGLYGIAPVRNDYAIMKITNNYLEEKDNENFNYYDIIKNQFIFNKFKTSDTIGQVIINLPIEAIKVLKLYSPFIVGKNNFLFVDSKDNQYKDDTFGKYITSIFNGNSINTLRKVYNTEHLNELREMMRKVKDISYRMMNSPNVIKDFYAYENKI